MLATVVDFSIRFRGLVAGAALVLAAYGIFSISRAGLDIFPEFSPKAVIVQTEAPGMSADQVEIFVTRPVESAVSGLIGLSHVRSESIQGLSIVTVVFNDNTDIYRNRQLVAERLATLRNQLPDTVATPVAVPLASSSATVRTIGVESEYLDQMALRDLVDTTIVPRLLSVPGVADVNVFGGGVRTLQIQAKPEALERFAISINELLDAARAATAGAAIGFVENDNQRITLAVDGRPYSSDALSRVVVRSTDTVNITIGDVADVKMAGAPPIGAAQIMGRTGIVMMIIGQYGANTLTVSTHLEEVLNEFKVNLESKRITLHPSLFVPANYIESSLANISEHLRVGGTFVLIILVLFLFDVKAALISAVAIPLSLLGAVIVLLGVGVNLNIMVLGGLAIALGEVVDDAIIDTENIYRRLRENRKRAQPVSTAKVVFNASMEVRGSVVYASFIVALVFVPLLTLSGVAGRLFAPLGVAYILAILVSLVVALTVTPALCCLLLGGRELRAIDPPLMRLLKPAYRKSLRLIGRYPKITIIGSLAACGAALSVLPTLGAQFLPALREGHYIVHTTSLPGTSLNESIRIGSLLTRSFLAIDGVRSVSQWAGRAERGADTYGSHYSEYEVALAPMSGARQQEVLDRLRQSLGSFPGLLFEANTFLTERVDETISGYASPVVVNIYGSDLDALDQKARELVRLINQIAGASDAQMRSIESLPVAQVRLDMAKLASWGVRSQDVLDALEAYYRGAKVGNAIMGNRVVDILVILQPQWRDDLSLIADLPIRAKDDKLIPLHMVAEVDQIAGRYNILHRDGQRLQAVSVSVHGRDLQSFMQELRRRVRDEISLAPEMHLEFTGAGVEQKRARQDLILHSVLAGLGVLMLIYVAIRRLRNVLLILVNLPFALAGGVAAVLVTGATLSIGSVVGFVTLFGITVRNSIMLVSHYQYLVDVDGKPWDIDTALIGAEERLPSIAMTALVTALAMLPIAIDSDNAGREIMGPMAVIIIGGLLTSALLNLLVMPTMMLHFGKFNGARLDEPPSPTTGRPRNRR